MLVFRWSWELGGNKVQIKGGSSGDRILDIGQHRVGDQGRGAGVQVNCHGAATLGGANTVFLPWLGSGVEKL